MRSRGLEERLNKLAEELVRTYPYYMSLGLKRVRFDELPVIGKQTINGRRNGFELERPAKLIESFTSGSTGIPFRCVKTAEEQMVLSMAIQRRRLKRGLPVRHRSVLLGDTLLAQPRLVAHYANRIAAVQPHMIQGRCSSLYELAVFMAEHDRPVPESLLFVQNWGENVQPAQQKTIEDVFGVPLLDYYGIEEIWMIAFSNARGQLEIDEHNVYVEVLDPTTGQSVKDGDVGELVVTSFVLRQLPIVRYRTGDIGRIHRNGENGRGIIELFPVRSSQIRLRDRTVNAAVFRYLDQFYAQLALEFNMKQFQMVQETYSSFRLLIVSDEGQEGQLAAATSKLEALLKQSLLIEDAHIVIERTASIAPHPASGKFQPFVSLV